MSNADYRTGLKQAEDERWDGQLVVGKAMFALAK